MTRSVSLHHAKLHLSALVDAAAAGAEIVISQNGEPKARLIGIPARRREYRHPAGVLMLEYMADDFNASNTVVSAQFEGR